ncbi:Hydrogenase-4 component B [Raoultella terrigena]|uniref:Hydrogenase-4 component B n=1 Tax=Raoultella terrigena TaxID=577 RepID=A0A3P8K8U6_RAOTE|nr:Hydrogenase-4 component B [Raoultella terrigena]
MLALLFSLRKPLSGAIAGIGGAVASAMLIVAGMGTLLMPGRVSVGVLQMLSLPIRISGINALWLLAIGLSALPISLFNIAWHRHPQVKANGLLVNLLLAAATCAVVTTSFGSLVVMAEIMALCGAFLTGCAQSGKLWFALGRFGTLLLAWSCWLVWSFYGTLDLAQISLLAAGAPQQMLLWLPALAGFALLAGVIPLHGWAPQAHADASAPAAALFSTVVMKVGLFGILTVSLAGGVPPLWWGVLLLVLGMITAFIGGLYALMEHNIQRLLAYHTLENIGIILLGLGAFVTGVALDNASLMVLGFIGGMYHLINHGLFKTTLFLGAGAMWFRTGPPRYRKARRHRQKDAADFALYAGGPDGDGGAAAAERLCRRVGYLSVVL